MVTSAHARLVQLQHRIYRALQREAMLVFGRTPSAIRRYEVECHPDFSGRSPRVSTKAELVSVIRNADVSFIADYHPYAQAQRTALRLLREAVLPGEKWLLGLELIPSQYQPILDNYQAGKISVEKFHALIRYHEDWGFPWQHYEPLFSWARKNGVRLIALNRPKELIYRSYGQPSERSIKDLHARDQWAAGIIADCFHENQENPKSHTPMRMLVLYGGYHVGRVHLPEKLTKISRAFLGKALRSVSVYQNVDAIYWRLALQERELHAQVLKFTKDVFCVFSGTPWAQLQSLMGMTEGESLTTPDEDDDDDSDREWDSSSRLKEEYLSLMNRFSNVLAEFFGLESPSFETLSLHTIEEADFVDSLADVFMPGELRLIRALVSENHRLYLSRAQVAYLASPSHNVAAEYAAIHLLRSCTSSSVFFEGGTECFFRLAIEATFGFLGSLILNPRRKCDLPPDHRRRLKALKQGKRAAFANERKARTLALAALTPGRGRKLELAKVPAHASSAALYVVIAARYAGQMLAKAIYPVILDAEHGSAQFTQVVQLFTRRRGFKVFEETFVELYALALRSERVLASKTEEI
ncbi:ChaN family lipoprotein [Bdellovibrionota bacterium FG-1]